MVFKIIAVFAPIAVSYMFTASYCGKKTNSAHFFGSKGWPFARAALGCSRFCRRRGSPRTLPGKKSASLPRAAYLALLIALVRVLLARLERGLNTVATTVAPDSDTFFAGDGDTQKLLIHLELGQTKLVVLEGKRQLGAARLL